MNLRKIIKNFISLSGSVLAWRCTELKSWADQIVRLLGNYRIPLNSSQITRVLQENIALCMHVAVTVQKSSLDEPQGRSGSGDSYI